MDNGNWELNEEGCGHMKAEEEDEVIEMTSCGETDRGEKTITKGDGHSYSQLAGGTKTKRGGYHVTNPNVDSCSESNEGEGSMDLCNYKDGGVGRSYQVGGGEFSSYYVAQLDKYRNIELAMSPNAPRNLKNTSTSAFESNVGERACNVSTFPHCCFVLGFQTSKSSKSFVIFIFLQYSSGSGSGGLR